MEVLSSVLKAGDGKDKADKHESTAMHKVVEYSSLKVVCCLLQAGADEDKADNHEPTAMHFATGHLSLEVVRCLLHAWRACHAQGCQHWP